MMNKLGLIIVSVIFALIQTGCAEYMDVFEQL